MYLARSDTERISDIAASVDNAFYWIGGISLFLLVGVTVVMIAFVIKYRRSKNPRATQIAGNTPLEITWIVLPTLLVLFMFFKGYEGFKLMRDIPEDAMTVEVLAQQWFWTFNYPEEGISSPELYVPVNTPIRFNLTARDVVHSFYLPAFRVKEDCVPGRQNRMWIDPKREGTYNIFCAEYCGKDHSKMLSLLHVLSEEAYREWLEEKTADRNKPVDMAKAMDPNSEEIKERDGSILFKTYCISCHGKEGRGGLVEGARDFHSLEGWNRGPKLVDIYRTLEEGIEDTQMRAFDHLPPWDRFALMHYAASFYEGADRPKSTPGEIEELKKEYRLDEVKAPKDTISIEKAMDAIIEEGNTLPN